MNFDQSVAAASALFANPAFVDTVCGLFVVCSAAIWLYSSIRMRLIARDTRLAIAELEQDSPDKSDRFLGIADSPVSKSLVQQTKSLIRLGDQFFRNPVSRTHEGFESLVHAYTDTRMLDAWPNIFVGMGLLLTFLGLALSLWNASRGAASGDISVVKQSVTTLLEFSATKFTTSLVALGCSIFLGIVLRVSRRKAELNLRRVDDELEAKYPLITSEWLSVYQISAPYRKTVNRELSDTLLLTIVESTPFQLSMQRLDELLEQSREQTANLQAFNSGLAIQLGEALDNKLQPMLQHLTDRLETALREMGGSIGSTNQSALKVLLESFVDELRSATKNDSAELQKNLANLAETLGRTTDELAEKMTSAFSGMEATGDRFAAILSEAGSSFGGEMSRVQSDVGSSLAEAIAAIRSSAEESSRQSASIFEHLSSGADSFRSNIEQGAGSFANEIDRGVRSIDDVVARLGASVAQLGTFIQKASAFGETSARVSQERIDGLNATLSAVDLGFRRVNEASVPFAKAADQVRASVDLLRVTESSIQSRVADFTASAAAMSNGSTALSESMSRSVTALTTGLGSTTERLTASVEAIAAHSEQAGASLSDAIKATLAEYETRFGRIDHELQQALTTIVDTFAKTYEDMRARIVEVDEQMAASVNRLATFNETFSENTEELGAHVEKLAVALAR